ncbi:hypothetical protein E4L96_14870 [Massilia arenosa]|uniref:DUF5615 domain-containing protein n=1 Tax=Zemynaea arenosa TaxID=2561931 RepID=A0A4Y9S9L5_9BURK|nr:DUF5615 family PIN-like protein [Massilia arenosa]TFW17221.1 hypothetical protein E4L96_14870 [Massilia arenosa]
MRILLDESMPAKFGRHLSGHFVRTVPKMGWGGLSNGFLLKLAAQQFDVLVTVDQGLEFQQNVAALPIAIVILKPRDLQLATLVSLIPQLEKVLTTLAPRSLAVVGT